jgi:cysteine desulfurase
VDPIIARIPFHVIYLDNNATTRPSAAVSQAVATMLGEWWGNPSSMHRFGQGARAAVERARGSLAALIGARAKELTLTGSGTEAIDLAIRGV